MALVEVVVVRAVAAVEVVVAGRKRSGRMETHHPPTLVLIPTMTATMLKLNKLELVEQLLLLLVPSRAPLQWLCLFC